MRTDEVLGAPLSRAVGSSAAALEKSLGLRTVGDLLHHYPRRYQDRGKLTDLTRLPLDEHVTVMARVERSSSRRTNGGKYLTTVVVTDGRGSVELTWFGRDHRLRSLTTGKVGLFSGKVSRFRTTLQLLQPDFMLLDQDDDGLEAVDAFTGALVPVYAASAQMPTWKIAKAVRVVLDTLPPLDDPLPPELHAEQDLISLREALQLVHQPRDLREAEQARRRLRWDEAFVLQTLLVQRRVAARSLPATPRPRRAGGLLDAYDARLPFELTRGQVEVGAAIEADLARTYPMNRLLQGEVGSGKTLVALRAMLTVVDAGGQAVLLAPTEVLAQQHARSIRAALGPLAEGGLLGGADSGTRVALLTGSLSTAARRRALLEIASGDAGIVVGTHALLEDRVQFLDLGLVVVDEQHRFGVEQRDALRARSTDPPHVLVMTATPIPRTIAMTAFGDLEVSELTELPAGRSPIATHVVPAGEKPHFLERTWQRLREEVAQGRQAYLVFPRIGDSPTGEGGVEDEREEPPDDGERRPPLGLLEVAPGLAEGPLAGLRTEVLHGRMHPDDKDRVMRAFAAGEVDVLLATTVIEVGVDVPNATVMVVLDADRFGVSQLHQLRGRVGRGGHAGLCLLVTDAAPGSGARERLDAVAATTDGFALSRLDLEMRREGDVLGARQSGTRSSLRLLSVLRDEDVIAEARAAAERVIAEDPALQRQPLLRLAIEQVVDPDRVDYLDKA
ncbi:ATP-dependent DNA helicase RecG [Motilibacter rhizosphaerae]|uniref:Probable DNA 3'-5' helicase RecG n=1 Tax=Motilibacter rhizosphaerae TaxID=598652 RepID=A0A4Q7NP27_9ACTN|nr:ATP-dependent DNA helicase RecG [Motilibacter rhizosphaerae]RZS87009.1 ATP-dependent DNA helicase RecG [Motilibacter rhizosphaerae]